MIISRNHIKNLFIWDFFVGIAVFILLSINPNFTKFKNLFQEIYNRNEFAVLYIIIVLVFLMITYISFLMGLYVVYKKTIGKIVVYTKELMGLDTQNHTENYREEYDFVKVDIIAIAIYSFVIIPIMLYILLPALLGVLGILFTLYIIMKLLSE